jgi:hypothetical protein
MHLNTGKFACAEGVLGHRQRHGAGPAAGGGAFSKNADKMVVARGNDHIANPSAQLAAAGRLAFNQP